MSRPRLPPRRKFDTRRFTIAVLLLLSFAIVHVAFIKRGVSVDHDNPLQSRDLDEFSKKNRECRQLHHAKDKCKYVRKYCADENAGLIPYLTLYYCELGNVQPLAFTILVAWTGMLFNTIGIAASDFFSVNLSTIASTLGLSESLAGVTFLAFGNGSPDVFSTFAAMGSNSGSMAVGELIGAAGFITAVVAGSMALVREFKVSKKTYIRDICFFIVAATFTFALLIDGKLQTWECASMIGFYAFYVVVVVSWHWFATRRKRRRQREAASRSNFYGPGLGNEDMEPYHDDEEEEERTAGARRRRTIIDAEDISALENGPRIELEDDGDGDEDLEDLQVHVAAEMTSSMRVLRPRGRRSTTTLTPIRPSLVGALEFRSVLSSLQRERNMRLRPIQLGHGRSYSVNHIETSSQPAASENGESSQPPGLTVPDLQPGSLSRDRAFSSNDLHNMGNRGDSAIDFHTGAAHDQSPLFLPPQQPPLTRSPSPSPSFKVGERLAPPPGDGSGPHTPTLTLQIPHHSPTHSAASSPTLSPFPALMESPLSMSPTVIPHHHHHSIPSPSLEPSTGVQTPQNPRPIQWWPYNVLPPPQLLAGTMFPTLIGWSEKSIWDKFVSVISVPSILCLVLTLPVVEADSCDDEDFDDEGPIGGRGGVDVPLPPVITAPEAENPNFPRETEWQRYRRSTRSHSCHSPQALAQTQTPLLISVESPHDTRSPPVGIRRIDSVPPLDISAEGPYQPVGPKPVEPESESSDLGSSEFTAWNRWLVAIQIMTGPVFVMFIVWANMLEELENPGMALTRMMLYALLIALVLLGVLFTTTSPDKKPKFHYLLCFLGFIISIAWISTVAGEVVGTLKAFGVILGISEAILGLTIFAVGNSLGDLVADVTVARLGYPMMALSACFGGPMLNILLGIGLGGLFYNKGLHIEVGGTLIVSAITLMVTLTALLIVVPMNKWVMSRKIGWGLIGLWSVSTVLNLVIEVSGIWRASDS